MANKLIAQNATFTIAFAGAQDGAPSAYGTAVSLQCLARSIRASRQYSMTNLAAICDTAEQNQVVRLGGTVEIEAFVDATDQYQFATYIGYYAKVIFTPKASGTTQTYEGVLTGHELGADEGGPQTEKLTITLGVNGV